jgi:demethylmenaquinone methyltransferase/2-methoxy-6-polyprenyl-1,4-benzoquinol methylase
MTHANAGTSGDRAGRPEGEASKPGSGAMFDAIAERYDLLNRINSLGMDRRWRRKTVEALELSAGHRLLDIATGTADLLLEVARRHPDVGLVGLDPSEKMISIGRAKLESAGARAEVIAGDAQRMPFDDESFDRASICFGIRNVPDRELALSEMHRVLKPGGRLAVLELSEPKGGPLSFFARIHVAHVVPRVGAALSRGDEYEYLRRSIAAFPRPEIFAETIRAAGFARVTVRSFAFGACVLFVAERE